MGEDQRRKLKAVEKSKIGKVKWHNNGEDSNT